MTNPIDSNYNAVQEFLLGDHPHAGSPALLRVCSSILREQAALAEAFALVRKAERERQVGSWGPSGERLAEEIVKALRELRREYEAALAAGLRACRAGELLTAAGWHATSLDGSRWSKGPSMEGVPTRAALRLIVDGDDGS